MRKESKRCPFDAVWHPQLLRDLKREKVMLTAARAADRNRTGNTELATNDPVSARVNQIAQFERKHG
jgi:hypothetical protein